MKRAMIAFSIALALIGAFMLGRMRFPLGSMEAPIDREIPDDIARAWSAVHASPSDPNAWAALGDAQATDGDLASAEHAYLTAIRMGGDNGLAYARLGFLHYAHGEDDRALSSLLEAKARGATVPMLDYTIDILRGKHAEPEPLEASEVKRAVDAGVEPSDAGELGEADADVPPPPVVHVEPKPKVEDPEPSPQIAPVYDGVCSVPARPLERGRTYALTIAVYGHWADLIIDTGASISTVTSRFADAVRLPRDSTHRIFAMTANGRTEFGTAIVPEIVLADRVMENVRVAICDQCVEEVADGLLGLDLIAAFGLRLDLAHETVHFSDCD